MMRPKRWFLVQDTDSTIIIKNTDGLIKKPNASRSLGKVVEVSGDTRLECVYILYAVRISLFCTPCSLINAPQGPRRP